MSENSNPNDYQIGGKHYQKTGMQHWDIIALLQADYFTGCATKYIARLMEKDDPITNLCKARHFLAKRETVYGRTPVGYIARYYLHRQTVLDALHTLYGCSPIGRLQHKITRSMLEFRPCGQSLDALEKELELMLEPNARHTEPQ